MALRKATPVRFTPRGLSDAFDATDTFLGACRDLQDLVFDRDSPELLRPRPGVTELADIADSIPNAAFVSLHFTVQPRVYGMVADGSGFDKPFCYDVAGSSFVLVSGATNANTPTSPGTSGAWRPPVGAVIGTDVIIAHAGYSGSVGEFFGVIDVSTFGSPAYSAANTATNPLPSVPIAVANYRNRAYYACGNQLWFSDNLDALTITNATQFLVIGDSSDIIGLVGLPVQTASGGVVGALLIYKEGGQIWQLRGDVATSDLELSPVSLNIGTLAPRSCVLAPEGTYFAGTDGPYVVDTVGRLFPVRANQNSNAPDVSEPFRNATTPSRSCAAFAGKIYRWCGDTIIRGEEIEGADYWFDTNKRRWNGIHSFAYDCASPYDNYFILSSKDHPGLLLKSQAYADVNTVYTDLDAVYSCQMTSSSLPKTGDMNQKFVIESTIELGSLPVQGNSYSISLLNTQYSPIDYASFGIAPFLAATLWNGTLWGSGVWNSGFSIPEVYNVNWAGPLLFQKCSWQVNVQAAEGVAIGTAFLRYQDTGYVNAPNQ